jgi:hypothetical protein
MAGHAAVAGHADVRRRSSRGRGLHGGVGTQADGALAEASDGLEAEDGFASAGREDQVGALVLSGALLVEGGEGERQVAPQGMGVGQRRQGGLEV